MSGYQSQPDLVEVIRALSDRIAAVEARSYSLPSYTTAGRPAASSVPRSLIFVSDAAAGSKFQGSDGAAWVALG